MSRHRAAGPLLADPLIVGRVNLAAGPLANLLGSTDLERLQGLVLAFPRTAERLLNERHVPDAVVRNTLLAEAALRLDRAREAVGIAQAAVQLAAREIPVDPGRVLPAATVLADAAVLAGTPDTIDRCTDLVLLARRYGDEHRATVAAGLHAVAIYQAKSCREAVVLLHTLGRSSSESETVAAIGTAIDAVETCCACRRQPHWPPTATPVITSGGLVQPALCRPFLADRLLRWPGAHDCASPSGTFA